MMKKTLLLAGLLFLEIPSRGEAPAIPPPINTEAETPEYFYCEIIADHQPSYQGDGVIFDFGQKTEAWSYIG